MSSLRAFLHKGAKCLGIKSVSHSTIRSTSSDMSRTPTCDKSSTAPGRQKLTLFHLPAELRNRIYRYALVTPNANGETIVDHTNYAQSALLRTSRQLRHEASPVFYFENVFRFACPDFDCTTLVSFSRHYRRYWSSPRAGKFKFEIGGQKRCWKNLERWCRLVHARYAGVQLLMRRDEC